MRKIQVQQVAIARRRQVKWSKDKDVFVFDVKAFGDANCTRLERESTHKLLSSARDVTDNGQALWLHGDTQLHHPERLNDSDSDAHAFQERLRATLVERSH